MSELRLLGRGVCRGQVVAGARLRGLLALLAEDLRAGCSTARLVAGLWPEEQPENPTKAVQVLVSRARSQFGADLIASTPTGYRLALTEDQVDTSAVLVSANACAQSARAGDHAAALARAETGLAYWEDGATDDPGDDPLSVLRATRASTYHSLIKARALALARLGRRDEAIEALTPLIAAYPRDEELLLELLKSEAATVGPSKALARYDDYRRELRDELGTDPGAGLQAFYRELLQEDAPTVRHGVPHEPNALLGRDADIAAVASLIHSSRVTSIVGPGGLGKTRLAQVVSRQAEQRSVHFIGLAGVRADEDVAFEVASAFGVGESRRTADQLVGIIGALGAGPVLLVLDNCEQVIRGVAELVQSLVAMTQDLRVLTTTRAPLDLSSEAVYLLPELDLPTSIELFGQRARAARPNADLPTDAVADLCRQLDGLPLAVELAAARVRVLQVSEIARRLEDRFALLRGASRDKPERHQTLYAVVDWSWNLLEPSGQTALTRLSIFPGGFTAPAAQHLIDDDALDILEHLVDQSLLKATDTPVGLRFRMLETVREFSTAHRPAEDDGSRARFLNWAREFGVLHHAQLYDVNPGPAIQQVRAEQDNLVHALRWAIADDDHATIASVTAVLGSLWNLEFNHTRMTTLVHDTEWVLSHYRPEPEYVEVTRTALALAASGVFLVQGAVATRALVGLRRLPAAPPDTIMRAVAVMAGTAYESAERFPLVLREFCESPEPLLAGVANAVAGYLAEAEGDLDNAMKAATVMHDAFAGSRTPWMRLMAHLRISELCLQVEQGAEGRRHMLAAQAELAEIGEPAEMMEFQLRWGLVLAALQMGDADETERLLAHSAGMWDGEAVAIPDLGIRAEIALSRGQIDDGLALWRQAVRTDNQDNPAFDLIVDPAMDPWVLEVQAAAVVAHAQHGRLDEVADVVAELPAKVSLLLSDPVAKPVSMMEFPACGALLLALGMVDLDRGATASGVRLIALASRLRFLRNFQPTMSAVQARIVAEKAGRPEYVDWESSYAGLGRGDLRAAALAALKDRDI